MSGFTENRASWASERPDQPDLVLTWSSSLAMLPLVARIVADVVRCQRQLARLQPEKTRLDRQRHTLAWPERARRYQLQEETVSVENDLRQTLAELDTLGVVVLDAPSGLVGFPTLVNDRRAFFSWKLGEEGLSCWSYAGDDARRPVPLAWTNDPAEQRPDRGKSKA